MGDGDNTGVPIAGLGVLALTTALCARITDQTGVLQIALLVS